MSNPTLVRISRLSKSYGGVHAIADVSIDLRVGEVHALCGENGAGKSTLIKCVSGVVVPDSGSIEMNDEALPFGSVAASEKMGVAVIHQESTTFPDLNTCDNIFVGREPRSFGGWLINRHKVRVETESLLEQLGQSFNTKCPVRELSLAERQMVAMARALSQQCRLLILDEPTASLSARETDVLLKLVRRLRDKGVTILYVSHRLEEVFALADRVTVLRDGQYVATRETSAITKDELIHFMVGREMNDLSSHAANKPKPQEKIALKVHQLSAGARFQDISFQVHAGEIVGLAGLVGAGRSEVARALFGIDGYDSGEVTIDGKLLPRKNVSAAMRMGLGLVPEDRQHEGLLLPMTVRENMTLSVLPRLSAKGLVSRRHESTLVQKLIDQLQIKTADHESAAETLSGGNQQKIVLGKWLATDPKALILDEPTRGVDVGAKAQVHDLIRQLAHDGMATLVISSELPELLSLCDRILVMRQGRIAGEVRGDDATQERILELALPDDPASHDKAAIV